MAAQDPKGGQKFWFNGLPYSGVKNTVADTGGVKFWFNGLPAPMLFEVRVTAGQRGTAAQSSWSKPSIGVILR